MIDIQIRRAKPTEAEILTHIAFAAKRYWGYPESYLDLGQEELTFTADYIETYPVYVAVDDDTPVGVYSLVLREDYQELDYLWVRPAYIGQGIGRRLVAHALDLAQTQPPKRLVVVADPHAVGFYKKMGFRTVRHIAGQPPGRVLPVMELTDE